VIEILNISKQYPTRTGAVTVLNDISINIMPGERIGILGRNGAGKSTLIRLISGAERPSNGHIRREMSVSWPLAFGGAFQGSLTGLDNLRFICRIYNVKAEEKVDFVQDFTELGRYFREPVKSYSSGMRARLAFALSMVIEFDCFLIDEIIAVGDSRFTEKCKEELFQKRADRAMIIVSHQESYVREHCTRAAVLEKGMLRIFDDVEEAMALYAKQLQ